MARKRKLISAVCEFCGGDFEARPDSAGRFCSVACSNRNKVRVGHHAANGGLSFDRDSGRWKIMCRDGTQMWFYRGVMAAQVGRLLTEEEIVHHRNGDPADDRPENLMLTTREEHIELHRAELRGAA